MFRNRPGFTLIELLIALVIGSLLGIAIFSLFKSQSDAYLRDEQRVEVAQNLRAAMEMVVRDVRSAGVFIADTSPEEVFHFGNSGSPLEVLIWEDEEMEEIIAAERLSNDHPDEVTGIGNDVLSVRTVEPDAGLDIIKNPGGSDKVLFMGTDSLNKREGDRLFLMSDNGSYVDNILKKDPTVKNCGGTPCVEFVFEDDIEDYAPGKLMVIDEIYYYIFNNVFVRWRIGDPVPSVVAYNINYFQVQYYTETMDLSLPGHDTVDPEDIRYVKIILGAETDDAVAGGYHLSRSLETTVAVRNLGLGSP